MTANKLLDSLKIDKYTKDEQHIITKLIDECNKQQNRMNSIIKQSDRQQKELIRMNEKLANYQLELTFNLQQKEKMLVESSKMAKMGKMIGNIAHQWRQPLSNISTVASGVKIKQEFDMLEIENLPKDMDTIMETIDYLAETINIFRNFLMEKKEVEEVVLQDRIDLSLSIVNAALKDNKIKVKNKIDYQDPIKIIMVAGELSEVIINIINNAKDILVEKNIQDSWIELNLIKKEDSVIITIEDNGGGIPEDILPKIFDEYFTTKDKHHGTGLGLYMSYKIVVESLKGKLYVKNTKNGAKFFIELLL